MLKEIDLTQGDILKTLFRFSLPVIAALFLQAMYGAVDLIIVGHFATTADVSGAATGSMLVHTITMVFAGLSMGLTILVGEAIGRKNRYEAGQIIFSGAVLFGLISLLFTAIYFFYSTQLANLMQAPPEALAQTSRYIFICGLGTVFIVAYNALSSVLRGLGDADTPLMTVAVACVINIGADLVLVAVMGWGAAGAALATVFSQAISVIITLAVMSRRKLPFDFSETGRQFKSAFAKKILILGTPIALQDILVGISFLVIQAVVNSMGVNQSAAVGIGEKISHFLMLLGVACLQSLSAFTAQNMGADQPTRAVEALWTAARYSFRIGLFLGLISFFFGDYLARIFASDPVVIAHTHLYLRAYAFDCFIMPPLFCFLGYFNGLEKTNFVMIQGVVGAFIVRLPLVLFISNFKGANLFHIGLSTPCASAIQAGLALMYYFYIRETDRYKEGSTLTPDQYQV